MQELIVFEQIRKFLTDIRELALMVNKEHLKLLRAITEYCKHLNESNFGLIYFKIEVAA